LVREAGLANVDTRVMDARHLDLPSASFDVAISRLLIMLVPEPHEVVAEVRRVLKPGARFAAIVWASAERNPGLSVPLAIARRRRSQSDPAFATPWWYALSEPATLEETLRRGGLHSVEVHAVPTVRMSVSSAEVVAEQRGGFPRLVETIDGLPEAEREPTWQEIEQALGQFAGSQGIEIPGELLIGVGTA
jgi:SAM-dependent methyltransferase